MLAPHSRLSGILDLLALLEVICLNDELKDLLYASSAKEREADARMLETIKSSANSSNCSCGQTAPPEYAADPTCCARGTEMVFTWRKSGCMEVRLNSLM